MNVGAGNSRLSEEMLEEGYTQIINIDISNVCTKAMAEKYKDKPETFKYLLMDVKAMDFPEASFDVVIDKATFDSVLVRLAHSVRRELHNECQQDDLRDPPSAEQEWCLYHGVVWTARISSVTFVEAGVRVEHQGAASG